MTQELKQEAGRDAFEAEVRRINPTVLFLKRWPDGTYKHNEIESMWQGWQMAERARAASLAAAQTPLQRAMEADAQAFEATLVDKPARRSSAAYPWGWEYASGALQRQFREFCLGRGAGVGPREGARHQAARWPFAETPGEFTERLAAAMHDSVNLLAAVRMVLIEQPPELVAPPPGLPAVPSGWSIKRTDKGPFQTIVVRAPDNCVASVSKHEGNPKNILYALADALLGSPAPEAQDLNESGPRASGRRP